MRGNKVYHLYFFISLYGEGPMATHWIKVLQQQIGTPVYCWPVLDFPNIKLKKAVPLYTHFRGKNNNLFFLILSALLTAVSTSVIYLQLSIAFFPSDNLLLFVILLLQLTGITSCSYAIYAMLKKSSVVMLLAILLFCIPLLLVQFFIVYNLLLVI